MAAVLSASPDPLVAGASRTALAVAWLRAAHQFIDDPPRILEDPIAPCLLGPDAEAVVSHRRAELQTPGARGWRSHVVLRSRYAEDRLAAAALRGVRQYVVLGAGYDTFAYRQPAWAAGLRVFEIDQPASQRAKREALAAAGVETPPNVTFVPVDFETDVLADAMRAAGVDTAAPVFFSWLGVMSYLAEPAADALLRLAASYPASSEIVLTFAPRDASRLVRSAAAVAMVGEPWRTFIDAEELVSKLRGFGFAEVLILTPAEAEARYFLNRSDGLLPPRRSTIAAAVV